MPGLGSGRVNVPGSIHHGWAKLWLAGVAGAGVMVTHLLAFALAAPDPHLRHELLSRTGHRYWPFVSAVAMALLVMGLAGFVAGHVGSRSGGRRGRFPYRAVALRLAFLQGGGFLALEGAERLLFGAELGLPLEPVVVIGLVVQVFVAVVAAGLLAGLSRTLDFLVAPLAPRRRGSTVMAPALARSWIPPRIAPATGGPTLRAPPAPR